jgi:type I restriction enzyme S subunit
MKKIEVTLFGVLNNRLDVSFYKNRFSFTSKSFPVFHLSELLWVNPTVKYENLSDNDIISFVPMEVVDEQNGKIAEQRTTTVSKTKGFTRFKENDLIWAKITPCMQNGKSAIARNLTNGYGCGSTEFYVLRPKTDNVLIKYIHFILRDKRVLESAKNSFGGSAGQQRVSSGYLKSIQIPLPPKKIQQQIVDLYNHAVEEKQAKEQEAAALLAGIDDYLLKELGIALLENVGNERYFEVSILDLIGGRLDPIYYSFNFSQFYKKYPTVALKFFCFDFQSGFGIGKEEQATEENGIIQIRPTNIDNEGELKFDKNIYVSASLNKSFLEVDDVLFNNTNSQELVGKTSILKENRKLLFSNHITRIKVDRTKANPDYLWITLNLYQRKNVFYSLCTNWNYQSGIGIELLKSLKIPLPPIEKQNEIAEHIQSIRTKAKQLREDAANALEKAKIEIEKMIIGE